MRYVVLGIVFFYIVLGVVLFSGHYGVAQKLAQYLFGFQVLFTLIYLIDLKLK